jgi:hypothetical protein
MEMEGQSKSTNGRMSCGAMDFAATSNALSWIPFSDTVPYYDFMDATQKCLLSNTRFAVGWVFSASVSTPPDVDH